MLQAANTDLFSLFIHETLNSECQNLLFPLQSKPVKSVKASLQIFTFSTLSTNGLNSLNTTQRPLLWLEASAIQLCHIFHPCAQVLFDSCLKKNIVLYRPCRFLGVDCISFELFCLADLLGKFSTEARILLSVSQTEGSKDYTTYKVGLASLNAITFECHCIRQTKCGV